MASSESDIAAVDDVDAGSLLKKVRPAGRHDGEPGDEQAIRVEIIRSNVER